MTLCVHVIFKRKSYSGKVLSALINGNPFKNNYGKEQQEKQICGRKQISL